MTREPRVDVLVDARPLEGLSRYRGVGTYAEGLLRELPRATAERGLSLGVLVEDSATDALPAAAAGLPRVAIRRRLPGRLSGFEDAFRVRSLLDRCEPRLYHSLEYSLPVSASCRTALTVHDLIPWLLPAGYAKQRLRWALQIRLARQADLLLCVSGRTRRDVVERLAVPPARAIAIHSGVDHDVFRPATPESVAEVTARFGLEGGYYLYVGEFDRRKNPGPAMAAVASLRAAGRPVSLAMVGRTEPYRVALELEMERFAGEGVRLLGHLAREDVVALYGGARALLMPSLYEGFGLPLLEAMACACPVVAFANSAIPEVAGRAGLLVEGGEDAYVAAVLALDQDPDLQQHLRAVGPAHAAGFRWDITAAAVADAYLGILAA